MDRTPPDQMPTVRESSTVGFRFSVGTWCAIIGSTLGGLVVFVGFCIWLNTMHVDLQTVKSAQEKDAEARAASDDRQAERFQRIEKALEEIQFRQKYGITAAIVPPIKVGMP